jgi:hypothetical protein
MTDVPKAQLIPGRPFEAKARKKRRKGRDPAPAATCTLPFDDVRPFLSGKPMHGLGGPPPETPRAQPVEPTPPEAADETGSEGGILAA